MIVMYQLDHNLIGKVSRNKISHMIYQYMAIAILYTRLIAIIVHR